MGTKITKRLEELHKKAITDGHWQLAAASHAALMDEANPDHQLNVVGAIHEVGQLRNRMEPFWQAWRTSPDAWAGRCVERLRSADRDYWALAALLAMDIRPVWAVLKKAGYKIMSVRSGADLSAHIHFATFSLSKDRGSSDIWSPVLELGWDAKRGEIVDAARFRAVLFDSLEKAGASFIGKGSGSNFMRAALPHGSWRVVSAEFELIKEAVIPIEKTLLKRA